MKQALQDIIAAWDVLAEGNYDPRTVEQWLKLQMAPAIDRGRIALMNGDYDDDLGEHK